MCPRSDPRQGKGDTTDRLNPPQATRLQPVACGGFKRSDWCIARQPRDTIEVGVITGEVGQTMSLHDRDDQGVTHEQFVLLADQSRGLDKKWSDCGDLDSQERDSRDGLD